MLLRQILTNAYHTRCSPIQFQKRVVKALSCRNLPSQHTSQSSANRPGSTITFISKPSNKPSTYVSFIKLLAPYTNTRAGITIHGLVKHSPNQPIRMKHKIFAQQSRTISESIRKSIRYRVQQDPRSSNAIARHDDNFCRLELLNTLFIIVVSAVGHTIIVYSDFTNSCIRSNLNPSTDCVGPVGNIRSRLSPLGTTR